MNVCLKASQETERQRISHPKTSKPQSHIHTSQLCTANDTNTERIHSRTHAHAHRLLRANAPGSLRLVVLQEPPMLDVMMYGTIREVAAGIELQTSNHSLPEKYSIS